MPVLEITEDQIIALLREMPAPQRERVFSLVSNPAQAKDAQENEAVPQKKPRPVFGSGKKDIIYIADDFDAPLDDFKEYME